jgi:hypothetical protein
MRNLTYATKFQVRRCCFENENLLGNSSIFKFYTKKSCRFECSLEAAVKSARKDGIAKSYITIPGDCLDFNFPSVSNVYDFKLSYTQNRCLPHDFPAPHGSSNIVQCGSKASRKLFMDTLRRVVRTV